MSLCEMDGTTDGLCIDTGFEKDRGDEIIGLRGRHNHRHDGDVFEKRLRQSNRPTFTLLLASTKGLERCWSGRLDHASVVRTIRMKLRGVMMMVMRMIAVSITILLELKGRDKAINTIRRFCFIALCLCLVVPVGRGMRPLKLADEKVKEVLEGDLIAPADEFLHEMRPIDETSAHKEESLCPQIVLSPCRERCVCCEVEAGALCAKLCES